MIDWFTIGMLLLVLVVAAAVLGGTSLLVHGAHRIIVDGRPSGHLMFWPGGAIVAFLVGGMIAIEVKANPITTVVIMVVLAIIAWGAVALVARSDR